MANHVHQDERLNAHLDRQEDTYLKELLDFLQIPSISAISDHRDDVRRAAKWLRDYVESIGLQRAEMLETAGHPVVVAEWIGRSDAPTVLVYGHYDVQPVDPLDLWTSPPFNPDIRDGKIFARGAADDKGQVMAVLQAISSMLTVSGELPINVKLLIEGEEEVGSPSLEAFLRDNRSRLDADYILIADTSMVSHDMPTICCGLRGICDLEIHVKTANSDLHSGLYGGTAPNAIHILVELLAKVREGQGKIQIPGFYDDVIELTAEERRQLAALPFDEDELVDRLGVGGLIGEPGYTALERMSVRPTLEVNGIWGGFQGEGTKTVIPNEAHAKVTCRLVPDQQPETVAKLVADYLKSQAPPSASVTVEIGHGARAWRCDPESKPVQAAVRALESAFQSSVALTRMGGSIPIVEVFDRLFRVPCVLMGFAAPDSNAHAPNEYFSVDTLQKARRSIVRFFHELADD